MGLTDTLRHTKLYYKVVRTYTSFLPHPHTFIIVIIYISWNRKEK